VLRKTPLFPIRWWIRSLPPFLSSSGRSEHIRFPRQACTPCGNEIAASKTFLTPPRPRSTTLPSSLTKAHSSGRRLTQSPREAGPLPGRSTESGKTRKRPTSRERVGEEAASSEAGDRIWFRGRLAAWDINPGGSIVGEIQDLTGVFHGFLRTAEGRDWRACAGYQSRRRDRGNVHGLEQGNARISRSSGRR